jgi:hypothetical protein
VAAPVFLLGMWEKLELLSGLPLSLQGHTGFRPPDGRVASFG